MSYLNRLSARMAGPRKSTPVVIPKGLLTRASANHVGQESVVEDEDTLSPLRRVSGPPVRRQEEEEEALQTVRRREKEEEEVLQTVRRQEEEKGDELQTVRRQEKEDEEPAQPLHRQVEEDEEEIMQPMRVIARQEDDEEEGETAQPLRRRQQEEQEEETMQTMRMIARQEDVPLEDRGQTVMPPSQASLTPGAEPPNQELADEMPPSELQALHREASTEVTASVPASSGIGEQGTSLPAPDGHEMFAPDASTAVAGPTPWNPGPVEAVVPAATDHTSPSVVIEQLDVLIHEPVAPVYASSRHSSRDRDRALRARYLRRL